MAGEQDYLANDLQTQLDRLNNQARFVKMIVERELVVSNRRKADIVAELRKKEFRPFPKVAKAKVAGEIEPVVEEEDDNEDEESGSGGGKSSTAGLSDYDYLLGMAIWSLTKEKVCQLLRTSRVVMANVILDREAPATSEREGA